MSCPFDAKRISALAAGAADAAAAGHAASCGSCRALLEELRAAAGSLERPASRATFGDLAARLAADRPEGCERHAESLSALAAGEREPEAETHLATCAACRDLLDRLRGAWAAVQELPRPVSAARFDGIRRRVGERPIFRYAPLAATLLLGIAIGWLSTRPVAPEPTPLERLLDAAGRSDSWLQAEARRTRIDVPEIVAALSNPAQRAAAIRLLDAVGGPRAEEALASALGADPATDAEVASALARRGLEVARMTELGREGRRDILRALLAAAPEGCAEAALGALRDAELRPSARRALLLRPERELRQVLGLYSYGPTPDEAAALVGIGHPLVRDCAIEAAALSRSHREACLAMALRERDVDFLMEAAGEDSLAAKTLDAIAGWDGPELTGELRRGLRTPALRLGAVRLAGRLQLAELAPAILAITAAAPPREERPLIIFSEDPAAPGPPNPLHESGLEALGRIAGRSFASVSEAADWVRNR